MPIELPFGLLPAGFQHYLRTVQYFRLPQLQLHRQHLHFLLDPLLPLYHSLPTDMSQYPLR